MNYFIFFRTQSVWPKTILFIGPYEIYFVLPKKNFGECKILEPIKIFNFGIYLDIFYLFRKHSMRLLITTHISNKNKLKALAALSQDQ